MSLHQFVASQFTPSAKCRSYSVKNLCDIKQVIYKDSDKYTVYSATQVGMMYGWKKDAAPYSHLYDWLANELFMYLNNGKKETLSTFDEWHKNVCNEFVSQSATSGIGCKSGAHIQYGIAQKFLNIFLKYCYCFMDADKLDVLDKFTYGHVALDGYTYCPSTNSRTSNIYRSYSRITRIGLREPFYTEEVIPTAILKKLSPWSKLSESDYLKIEQNIRDYFKRKPITIGCLRPLIANSISDGCSINEISDGATLTPFQTEFFLW